MAVLQKIRTGLVELRTDLGPMYVNPSFWARIYLLWTFRNFPSLPKEVLNRRERELIDQLCRAALVGRKKPVARTCVIGTVENVRLIRSSIAEATATTGKLIAMGSTIVDVESRAVGFEGISIRSSVGVNKRADVSRLGQSTRRPISPTIQGHAEKGRIKLGWALVAAVGAALVGTLVYFREGRLVPPATAPQATIETHRSLLGSAPTIPVARMEKVQQSAPPERKQLATMVASKPPSRAMHRPTLALTHPADATTDSIPAERLQVAEAPRSGFVYPVAPNPTLTGKVRLKTVIGIDGTVREVVILSGDRKLANAAARTVRHWQYRPHTLDGRAVEVETNITISFVGEDAVSITFPAAH